MESDTKPASDYCQTLSSLPVEPGASNFERSFCLIYLELFSTDCQDSFSMLPFEIHNTLQPL